MWLPCIHPTVDNRVVHGVTHGQPVDDQVHMLDVTFVRQALVNVHSDEVDVLGKPAYTEYSNNYNHHLHHLQSVNRYVFLSL